MGKGKTDPNARRSGETHFEHRARIARQKQNQRDRNEPIVPKEAQRHGDYRSEFVTHVETNTKTDVRINRGGDAVARWDAARKLSEAHTRAIRHMRHLWHLAGCERAVTASYGERLPTTGDGEGHNLAEIDARRDLHRIRDYFPGVAIRYFQVFENVVRFSMPAGDAGRMLRGSERDAKHAAYLAVCFVGDIIASKERL